MILFPLSIHWSQHIIYMSGKQDNKLVLARIPPQGRRKQEIVITVSSIEGDVISDSVLDGYILKIVMGLE